MTAAERLSSSLTGAELEISQGILVSLAAHRGGVHKTGKKKGIYVI